MDFFDGVKTFITVAVIVAAIIASQNTKYDDRKHGRRWWER